MIKSPIMNRRVPAIYAITLSPLHFEVIKENPTMSLRDQLLQAGIATKKQHQQARSQKKKQSKKKDPSQSDQNADTLKKIQEKQVERDKKLNQQRESERAQKALQAQIKQLILTNEIAREKGEASYRFTHDKKIKTLHLSSFQSEKIIRGNIAITFLGEEDDYHFVPWSVAAKLEEKDSHYVVVNNKKNTTESTSEEDDPYAKYEIPDDLMW